MPYVANDETPGILIKVDYINAVRRRSFRDSIQKSHAFLIIRILPDNLLCRL